MLKFFRKIRRDTLAKGATGKYVKYAIGEIVLVVIGILIALQLNNWNEDRKSLKDARQMLLAVQEENKLNIAELQEALKDSEHVGNTLALLLRYMGPDYAEKNERIVDSLFFEGLSLTTYEPHNAFILALLESGNLKYVENDSLHTLLLAWNSKLHNLQRSEATNLHIFKTVVLPYFYDKISLVKIDRQFDETDLPNSAFSYDNRKTLAEFKTENIIEDHYYNLRQLHFRYENFLKELQLVNGLITKELE